ncbi:hypothetical protein ANCCAN_11180 [Ancylostoma caninum]|uniref:Uncharacterized protein n=1 Tax=Ancylostoma caninum TaxID=29170 RepID=A0A368GEM5_ANCCA|nr:hypothetical protein ANCCAN_11180 [Ancylostoma caninum]
MVGGVRLLTCGRLAVRAVFSASALDIGSAVATTCTDPSIPKRNLATAPARGENPATAPPPSPPVVASCAGFPKVGFIISLRSCFLNMNIYIVSKLTSSKFSMSFYPFPSMFSFTWQVHHLFC